MELEGKVAVITGGGTGIGRATALLFAAEGASVIVAGRREGPLRETVDQIVRNGGRAGAVVADVTDASQARELIERSVELFGGIDILFNCAGVFVKDMASHEYSEEEWDRVLSTNLRGAFVCSKYAVPVLKSRGGGVIINCTSVSAHLAQCGQTPYNVSKAGLEMLSKCMARELGYANIRVNTICPSMTETDMAADAIARRGIDAIAGDHPIRRIGQPMDCAQAALYLASERASWVSGNSLFVDGGNTCL